MKRWLCRLYVILPILLSGIQAEASHLFGADLYYTYIGGNSYTINMVVYGDCSGSAAAFNGLYTATPEIEIYNGGSLIQTIYLTPTSTGVEVTPVCPAQINNTSCNGGSVPGVRQFIYTDTVTLGLSANWMFRFTGDFFNGTIAGRSNSITNIIIPGGGSFMILEATLNNMAAPNSSPVYTTIPTPFFCINKPAQYNPGAVDADNDALTFSLTPGLTTGGVPVNYIAPFTAVQPLATTTGTFSFSSTTGQLGFTPNLVQNALVVGRVEEYRNGVLVGTSMREMTFVVLNNCNNNPPTGNIGNPIGGVAVNGTTFRVCQTQPGISFSISPTDLDGDNIDIATAGIPAGAVVNITGNNTAAPVISFSWNTANVAVGSYTFFVTYTDNGCPLSSKQTIAYTINVVPKPVFTFTQLQAATCVKKAVYNIAANIPGPYILSIFQNNVGIQNTTNVGISYTDSLAPGTYILRLTNTNTCFKDTTITIASPLPYNATYTTTPSCSSSGTGTLSAVPSGGLPPYQYALGTGTFTGNPLFTGLAAGTYTYRILDGNYCIKDTTLTIPAFPAIIPAVTSLSNALCPGQSSGSFTITASAGNAPYTYSLNGGLYGSINTFNNLAAGTHTINIKDANNCIKDTSVAIASPPVIVPSVPSLTNALCSGQSNGAFTISAAGGTPPYTFAFNGGPYSNTTTFSNLAAGSYVVSVKDANNCIKDTTVTITQPTVLLAAVTLTKPLCAGDNNGSMSINGSGGTVPYTYALGTGVFSGSTLFTNIGAGVYILHVKDANGCTRDTTVTLTEPAPVAISYTVTDAKCFGEASGSVTITGAGGTPGYTYSTDGSAYQASGTFNNMAAGTHTVSVRDNNGCTIDAIATISEPTPVVFGALAITHPTCEGFTDGQVIVTASGGLSPYQFSKDGSSYNTNFIFTNLPEGAYKLYVRDNNGCVKDTTISLEGYPGIDIDSTLITPASCNGQADGSLTVYASGGNPPLSYAIGNGNLFSNGAFTGLSSTTYNVQVVDDKGCKVDTAILIPSQDVLDIKMEIVNNDCLGANDNGSVTAVVTGGNQPYSYQWSNAQTTATVTGLDNGFYAVTVKDAKGCTDTAAVEVTYDDCCTVFVPNAFTPNSDGRNDELRVLYKGDMRLQQLSIYNRFGQRVFYTTDINDNWTGIFNGQQQELGTYFYYLTVICGNKGVKTQLFKGDVVLVR